jgi:prepilin-type N-terminal cleavage/methylation domain-containing protein
MRTKLNSSRGVTILELLIAVVIVGIAAGMAVPRFQIAFERARYKAGNKEIVSSLRKARSMALSDKRQYGVYFDETAMTVTTFRDDLNPSLCLFEAAGDSVIAQDTLPVGFHYLMTDCTDNVIVFMPNGSAQFAGGGNIYTYAYSPDVYYSRTHNVLASTGRVKSIDPYDATN